MVILSDDTEQTESGGTATTTAEEPCDCEDGGRPDPADGLAGRLVDYADRAATFLEPFATLLTAMVQAATVATLVRTA